MPANTNKLLQRYFVLDGDNMPIRGYYNPYTEWNGYQCPFVMLDDFKDFCDAREWTCVMSKNRDTIFVDFSDKWEDMEELPIVTRKNTRTGWATVIDLTGWCWRLSNENGELAGNGTVESMWEEIEKDRLVYNRFNHW